MENVLGTEMWNKVTEMDFRMFLLARFYKKNLNFLNLFLYITQDPATASDMVGIWDDKGFPLVELLVNFSDL